MNAIELVAQPTRLEIVRLIWERERTAGEIAAAFELTFGAISQHLRALEEGGIVEGRREWRHRYYRARKEALAPLAAYLEATWTNRPSQPKNQWPSGWL
jgi:DNA-binding transcriptional ArsR family regulator